MVRKALIGLVGLALLLELACRVLGLADVPIRSANRVTGYIPLPNQHGRFLGNEWTINGLSMISAATYDKGRPSIVLAGDSVIFGGNPLDQSERVGQQLTRLLQRNVYAIADGSWGFKNELAYFLNYEAALGGPSDVVFVLNGDDFKEPSAWRCFSHHPTSRPLSAAYFVLRKYTVAECEKEVPVAARVPDFPLAQGVERFLLAYPHTRAFILLYPTRQELVDQVSIRGMLDASLGELEARLRVVDLIEVARSDPQLWQPEHYADEIHPNPGGAAALARVIAEKVLPLGAE